MQRRRKAAAAAAPSPLPSLEPLVLLALLATCCWAFPSLPKNPFVRGWCSAPHPVVARPRWLPPHDGGASSSSSRWWRRRQRNDGGRPENRPPSRRGRALGGRDGSVGATATVPRREVRGGDGGSDGGGRERTVVILYHKPPNVVTSHSNSDAAPRRASEAEGHPSGHPTQQSPTSRLTVYEDVMSMRGYVANDVDDDSASAKGNDGGNGQWQIPPPPTTTSFERATGIRSKLHAVGRLDAETTGLLLLTNDGGLVHRVTNPTADSDGSDGKLVTKTYEAVIMGYHTEDSPAIEQIRSEGVEIGRKYGGLTHPARAISVLDHPTPKSTLVSITIAEGRNRQVRRMFHGVGSGVMTLHRTRVGDVLTLGTLGEGQWRVLGEEEVWEALSWRARDVSVAADGERPSERKGKAVRSRQRRRKQRPRR